LALTQLWVNAVDVAVGTDVEFAKPCLLLIDICLESVDVLVEIEESLDFRVHGHLLVDNWSGSLYYQRSAPCSERLRLGYRNCSPPFVFIVLNSKETERLGKRRSYSFPSPSQMGQTVVKGGIPSPVP
jgi:hypothetical protein